MRGIQFVVDETGNRTGVLIDLAELGDIWEDFYDGLIAESRADNPKLDWEEFEEALEHERADADVPDSDRP